ncbi:MAG: hypothetical protein RI883_1978 [Bacteroidota bacterium]
MEQQKKSILSERPFFENLNGLRFAGAIAVLLYHCFSLEREIWGDFYHSYWFQKACILISKGHLGFVLFFMLSGFLITYFLLFEREKTGKINLFNYIVRRFLRFWPLYFLIVIFGFFIFPRLPYGIETVHEFWRFALFLSNIDEILLGLHDKINFLSATWTVSIEEQFYLAWGFLFGIISFRKNTYYYFAFGFIIIMSFVFRSMHLDDHRLLYYHTFSVMCDLAFGGIIGLLAFEGKIQSFFERLSKSKIILLYLLSFVIIMGSGPLLKNFFYSFEHLPPCLVFSFVILEQVYAKNSFYKIDKIPYFFSSGELTYGIYLFHCIFIYYWSIFFKNHGYTEHLWQFITYVILIFICTYCLAWISLHFFERPILSLKKYFR